MSAIGYALIVFILFSAPVYQGLRSAAKWISARFPQSGGMPSFSGILSAKASLEWWKIAAIVLVVMLTRGADTPSIPTTWKLPSWLVLVEPKKPVIEAPKVDRVTYVHDEKAAIPPGVLNAINELNSQGVMASNYPDDATDNDDQVPDQYKIALPAAKAVGVPSLVVQSGDKVLRTVKAPTTKQQVLEASK